MGNKSLGHLIVALGDSARLPSRAALGLALLAGATIADEGAAQPRLQAESSQHARAGAEPPAIPRRARDRPAQFERQRRRPLPRFYTGTTDRCLIIGRFCEWHPPNHEDYVIPEEGNAIRRAREELLRDLSSRARVAGLGFTGLVRDVANEAKLARLATALGL